MKGKGLENESNEPGLTLQPGKHNVDQDIGARKGFARTVVTVVTKSVFFLEKFQ